MLCHPLDSGAMDSIIHQLKNRGRASEVQNKHFLLMFYAHQLQCKARFSLLTSSHSWMQNPAVLVIPYQHLYRW